MYSNDKIDHYRLSQLIRHIPVTGEPERKNVKFVHRSFRFRGSRAWKFGIRNKAFNKDDQKQNWTIR